MVFPAARSQHASVVQLVHMSRQGSVHVPPAAGGAARALQEAQVRDAPPLCSSGSPRLSFCKHVMTG